MLTDLIALTLTLVVNIFILKFLFALSGPMYSSVPEFSTEQNKKTTKRGCKVEDVVAFLQKHQNEGGWCDIDLLQKQQVDEKGRTHTAVLNDWKPSGQPAAKPAQLEPVASDNDLPF